MLTRSVIDDLKHHFRYGNMAVKLIWINVAVFIFVNLFAVLLSAFGYGAIGVIPENNLAMPTAFQAFLLKPWTLITYMFMHDGVMHILFNMLALFWFGQIFELYLGSKKILPVYILGGLFGGVLALVCLNLLPGFKPYTGAPMVGASGAIFAIVFAAATINPEHELQLLLFGRVRIKYFALVALLIGILSMRFGNVGGYICHVGGALAGYTYIRLLQNGTDLGAGFVKVFDTVANWFKPRPKLRTTYKNTGAKKPGTPQRTKGEQQKLDDILDKISRSGYDSLTIDEQDFLFHYSNK